MQRAAPCPSRAGTEDHTPPASNLQGLAWVQLPPLTGSTTKDQVGTSSKSIRCCNSTCTCPPSLASTQAALVFLSTYFSITSARSFSPEDRIRCPRPCLLVPMAFSVRSPLAGKVKGQVLAMSCEKRKIGWGTKTEGRRRGREECRESH